MVAFRSLLVSTGHLTRGVLERISLDGTMTSVPEGICWGLLQRPRGEMRVGKEKEADERSRQVWTAWGIVHQATRTQILSAAT